MPRDGSLQEQENRRRIRGTGRIGLSGKMRICQIYVIGGPVWLDILLIIGIWSVLKVTIHVRF